LTFAQLTATKRAQNELVRSAWRCVNAVVGGVPAAYTYIP
jgi:hypothetical protein